jgi:serine/threonine-protein phosphatase 2A activator
MTASIGSFPRVELDARFGVPEKKINSDADVIRFKRSEAFARVVAFIALLNGSITGKTCLDEDIPVNPVISRVIELLDVLNGYIAEIPPSTGPRRFGNVAFRTWMKRVEEVSIFPFDGRWLI